MLQYYDQLKPCLISALRVRVIELPTKRFSKAQLTFRSRVDVTEAAEPILPITRS